ncbi:F0F1 ATP synthase subunit A [Leptobacterium flavescens]|uniref:ATP synthase subunit a n=1 Tax=Leptobacterium flavescens TaxID=472055 RepID=A0A6P0UL09_9FLAO|nr:F0F1 ATP synthase subunit A [Leptobacterium flavescens]NER13222.1 F0F1 ATP synthase subunit A [Leptobacterium flavescens]
MHRRLSEKVLAVLLLIFSYTAYAQHDESHAEEATGKTKKEEIKEYIQHHLKDSHDFSIGSYTNKEGEHVYIGFPLPVILWDEGLKVFSSSQFHHGETVAQAGGNYYKLYHNKIYRTDAAGTISYDEEHHPTNVKPLDLSITKSVLMIIITGILMFLLFRGLARSYTTNGGIAKGIGRFFEPIVLYIRDDIAIPNIGAKHYGKYMPYLLTIFFFIWFLNIFGLTPLGVNVTGNIAITFALALLTFLITNLTANKNYWMHIFWMPGVPWPMKIILAPIELLGVFIKPFSLLIRLYANMQAGHIVLMSLIGLMFIFKSWIGSPLSFGLAFAISLIEVLVAVLQAYIFTMLSALYFGFAVEEHDHEEAH